MPTYRKKSVVVEAVQVTKDMINGDEQFPDWAWGKIGAIGIFSGMGGRKKFFVTTLEGRMDFDVGDYLVKGVKGEVYPCKADVFEMSYEEVDA